MDNVRGSYAQQYRASMNVSAASHHHPPALQLAASAAGDANLSTLYGAGSPTFQTTAGSGGRPGTAGTTARKTIADRIVEASEREAHLRMEAEMQALQLEELARGRAAAEARAEAADARTEQLTLEVEMLQAELEEARNDPRRLRGIELETELRETRALAARLKKQVEIAEERAARETERREAADRTTRDLHAQIAKLQEELATLKADAEGGGGNELTLAGMIGGIPGGPQVFQFLQNQIKELRGALDTAHTTQTSLLHEGLAGRGGGPEAPAGGPDLDRRLRSIDQNLRSLHATQQLQQQVGSSAPSQGGGRLNSSLTRLENKVDQLAEEMANAGKSAAAAAAMSRPSTAAAPSAPWGGAPPPGPPSPYLESMGVPGFKWHPYFGAVPTQPPPAAWGYPPPPEPPPPVYPQPPAPSQFRSAQQQQQQQQQFDQRQYEMALYEQQQQRSVYPPTDRESPDRERPPQPRPAVRIQEPFEPQLQRQQQQVYRPQQPPVPRGDSGRRVGGARSKSARHPGGSDGPTPTPPNKVREEDLRSARIEYFAERLRIQERRRAAELAELGIGPEANGAAGHDHGPGAVGGSPQILYQAAYSN